MGLLAASPALALVQHPNITGYMDSEWAPGIDLGPAGAVVGRWADNASAVALAPTGSDPATYRTNYIITTRHQGYGIGAPVNFGGADYSVYDIFAHPTADLRIALIRDSYGNPAALADWATPYSGTDEASGGGQTAVIGGFGRRRGAAYPTYYEWAAGDNRAQTWGQNRVETAARMSATSWFGDTYTSNVLKAYFDDYTVAGRVPYESAIAEFDSGGGWFLPSGGAWQLAGITAYADHAYVGQSWFEGAQTPSGGDGLYAIRISSYANWIDGVLARSTWNSGTGGPWSDGANWSGAVPDGPDKWAVFSDGVAAARSITLSGSANTRVGTIRFDAPGDLSIDRSGGSASLEFAVTIDSAVLEVFNTNGDGALTISAPIKLSSPLLVNQNSGGLLTLSGAISGSGKGLTKSGTGTVVLTSANSYNGGTKVNQGTLRVTVPGALGAAGGTVTLTGGGTLDVRNDSSLSFSTSVRVSGSSTINVDRDSSGTARTMTFSALTTDNEVTLHVTGGNAYGLRFSGLAFLNGLSSTGTVTFDTAGADLRLQGGLTLDKGTLAKTGAGTLTLSGTQTYGTGTALKVNGGTLALNADAGAPANYPLSVYVTGAGASVLFGVSQHLADLQLGGTGTASVASGGTATVTTRNLSIAGGTSPTARFDLNDNDLIVNYAGGTDPVAAVRGYLLAGYDSSTGLWTREGIVSSAAGILHPATTLVTVMIPWHKR
jgi:autotransporter-associated beta strand protein